MMIGLSNRSCAVCRNAVLMPQIRIVIAVMFFGLLAGNFQPICSSEHLLSPTANGGSSHSTWVKRQDDEPLDRQELNDLIDALGSSQFSERERAREALAKIGVGAFDALYLARHNRDLEIRMAARDLLARIEVEWSPHTDPVEIRNLMNDYGSQSLGERQYRIEALARLDLTEADFALIRIARYEAQERLSKSAALRLIDRRRLPADPLEESFTLAMSRELGSAERPSIEWLRLYLQTIVDPAATIEDWEIAIEEERSLLHEGIHVGQIDPLLLRDLMRWQADLLYAMGHREAGDEAIAQTLQYLDGSREQVVDTVDWLIERQSWEVIDRLVVEHPDIFTSDPFLLYHVAEVHQRLGRQSEADEVAEQAAQILGNDGRTRLETAIHLQQRGLEEWAIVEFQAAIDTTAIGSVPDADARMLLAALFFDRDDYLKASQLLDELVQAVAADPDVEKLVRRKRDPKVISSLVAFYMSHYELESGRVEEAWDQLSSANADDPTEPDVLILMYRVSEPVPEWRAETIKRIDTATGYFRDQIRFFESQLGGFEDGGSRQMAIRVLADYNNRLAWLIANTRGDLEEAMRCAESAARLLPEDAGCHDTLALCCWNSGDRQAAIKWQRIAVSLAPYSRPLQEQLQRFEAAESNGN